MIDKKKPGCMRVRAREETGGYCGFDNSLFVPSGRVPDVCAFFLREHLHYGHEHS